MTVAIPKSANNTEKTKEEMLQIISEIGVIRGNIPSMFVQVLLLLFLPFATQMPAQVDPDFASSVKEWTTKPEFISPLVDHLPLKPGVPTPKDVLGYHIGQPKKLSYTAD